MWKSLKNTRKQLLLCLSLIVSSIILTSCYSFSQTSLPTHLSSITIYPTENKTFQAQMGDRLTQGVQELFRREAPNLRQINQGAHSEFHTTLTSYVNAPMDFNSSGQVSLYKVTIRVDVEFKDNVKGYDIYKKKGLTAFGVYDISRGESEELQGQQRALEELQTLIVSNALSGW